MNSRLFLLVFIMGLPLAAFAGDIGAHEKQSCPELRPITLQEVPDEAIREIKADEYDASTLEVLNTRFFFLSRRVGGIEPDQFRKAVCSSWPLWKRHFDLSVPQVSFIDYNMGIGGGSFSDSVLGVYLGQEVEPAVASIIGNMLGWAPQLTLRRYIEHNYASFADPMQAYIDDMVTHELGHLLFGFGQTKSPPGERMWFALGLGIVYDRIIWEAQYEQPSPLFSSTVRVWRDRFKWRSDIDQRLINPDTSRDQEVGLIRHQSYDHGKAYVYLATLRDRIGADRFDGLIADYIGREYGSTIAYDDFLTGLTPEELGIVREAESEFIVR